MTHDDAGRYKNKHPKQAVPHPAAAASLKSIVKNGMISCADAHRIAQNTGLPPSEIGKAIDLLEYRITACQMGLFGYPGKKTVKPMEKVPAPLRAAITNAIEGKSIPCVACWRIAAEHSILKIKVASACEALGVKIGPCQLGAF